MQKRQKKLYCQMDKVNLLLLLWAITHLIRHSFVWCEWANVCKPTGQCTVQLCRYCGVSLNGWLIFGYFFQFFCRRHVAPINVKFGREKWTKSYSLPNLSVQGCGPYTIMKFTSIIAPKEQVPCTIVTKFAGFMLVLKLHNSATFGCFRSTNN